MLFCWVPSFSVRLFIHLNLCNRNWLAVVRDTKFLCTFTLYYKTISVLRLRIFLRLDSISLKFKTCSNVTTGCDSLRLFRISHYPLSLRRRRRLGNCSARKLKIVQCEACILAVCFDRSGPTYRTWLSYIYVQLWLNVEPICLNNYDDWLSKHVPRASIARAKQCIDRNLLYLDQLTVDITYCIMNIRAWITQQHSHRVANVTFIYFFFNAFPFFINQINLY